MQVTTAMVKELRERTQAGMMDCKNALVANDGDMEKAIEYLREKGLAASAKKAGRVASEGMVDSYIHMGGKIGVLVEVNCETDFVAKTDTFKELVHDIALQIAASNPLFVSKADVPQDNLDKEREILRAGAEGASPKRSWSAWWTAVLKNITRKFACWSSPLSRTPISPSRR